MPEKVIGDLFKIGSRFLRSTHLERDFKDPTVLSGYVMTDFTRSCLGRVASGLKPSSGQRAWRMTGGYGSGKSTFALLLAHWFAGRDNGFSSQIRKVVGIHQYDVIRARISRACLSDMLASVLGKFHPKCDVPDNH